MRAADYATFQGALDAAVDGADIYIDGTIPAAAASTTGLNNIRLYGPGTIQRSGVNRNDGMLRLVSCNDIIVDGREGLTFDANNVDRFGGVQFEDCHRIYIHDLDLFDSNPSDSWPTYDHYGLMIRSGCEHVWVLRCTATDIELLNALDSRHGLVEDCTVTRSAGTNDIALMPWGNGGYIEDWTIRNLTSIDPGKVTFYLALEQPHHENTTIRDITIDGVTVTRTTRPGQRLLALGHFQSNYTAAGNTVSNVTIRNVTVEVAAGLARTHSELSVLHTQSGDVFDSVTIEGVDLDLGAAAGGEWVCDYRQFAASCRIGAHTIRGANYGLSAMGATESVVAGPLDIEAATDAYQFVAS